MYLQSEFSGGNSLKILSAMRNKSSLGELFSNAKLAADWNVL
ncbi:MAG: hypothetical protein ACTTJ1_00690 [Treponema sp.]